MSRPHAQIFGDTASERILAPAGLDSQAAACSTQHAASWATTFLGMDDFDFDDAALAAIDAAAERAYRTGQPPQAPFVHQQNCMPPPPTAGPVPAPHPRAPLVALPQNVGSALRANH